MGKNKKKDARGIVYSTDPNFEIIPERDDPVATPAPQHQRLRVWLDTKNRGGKAATLIKGFAGSEDDLKSLAKSLKQYCGVGGSDKDGEIIIQGDQREKVLRYLLDNGYSQSKKAGS
jgi:translation initiation factor 1